MSKEHLSKPLPPLNGPAPHTVPTESFDDSLPSLPTVPAQHNPHSTHTLPEAAPEQLHEQTAFAVPHIEATFEGTYFKGVPGAMEVISFKEIVRIPNSWLIRDDLNPVFIFKSKFTDKVMRNKTGFSGVRTVYLTRTSELPRNLSIDQELMWTADYNAMVLLAKRHGRNRFIPLDPKEGTPLPPQTVEVKPEFFGDVQSLRNAIKQCQSEPEAFKREQDKMSSGYEKRRDEMSMQEEMAALGY